MRRHVRDASRASSFVFMRTSWRSPWPSSSISAILRRSVATSPCFSFSCSRVVVPSERSSVFTLPPSSLISRDWRKPCLAYLQREEREVRSYGGAARVRRHVRDAPHRTP